MVVSARQLTLRCGLAGKKGQFSEMQTILEEFIDFIYLKFLVNYFSYHFV